MTLTGGTGDVNPQWYSMTATETSSGAFKEVQYITPIPRYSNRKGKAIVLEVLKVLYSFEHLDSTDGAAFAFHSAQAQIATAPQSGTSLSSPQVVSFAEQVFLTYYQNSMPATSDFGAGFNYAMPQVQDLTDGAGHGVLVATDSIYMGFQFNDFDAAALHTVSVKMLYRFKEVDLAEYIGIVQSQQG